MEASLNDPINASIDKEIFLNKKKKILYWCDGLNI